MGANLGKGISYHGWDWINLNNTRDACSSGCTDGKNPPKTKTEGSYVARSSMDDKPKELQNPNFTEDNEVNEGVRGWSIFILSLFLFSHLACQRFLWRGEQVALWH